jgi:putative pyrimidine permease RutG
MMSMLPRWRLATGPSVAPDERLPWLATVLMGAQHVVAMSGSTILGPLLMGFDPNLAILFSGIGTLLFFLVTGGRLPSYLGSSFSFIAVVVAASGYSGHGPNPDPGLALGGIVAAGALYAAIGLLVMAIGSRWVEHLLPPVVTGAIGVAIGLNLAPVATQGLVGHGVPLLAGLFTVLAVCLVAVHAPPALRRISVLIGAVLAYGFYVLLANGLGLAAPVDFSPVREAVWFGLPSFRTPVFTPRAITLIAPVAIVLVAENLGHIKAVGAMTGRNLDGLIGRAFLGDGIATMVAGAGGGTGVTTYVENMGVMAISRVYSTLVFVVAALFALGLGLSPKFGAVLRTIPGPVLAGLATIVFGLIAATMVRVWTENRVDLSDARNLLTIGVAVIAGAGNLTIVIGSTSIGGIGTATIAAILLNQILRRRGA